MFLTLRILGLIVVAVFVASGLAAASTFLPLLISLGVLAAFGALCVRQEDPRLAASPLGRSPLGLATGVAAGFVLVIYVVIGMAMLLGGAATALTAATVLAVLGYRRLQGSTPQNGEHPEAGAGSSRTGVPIAAVGDVTDPGSADTAATEAGVAGLLKADPAVLSTAELCRAWRVSYLKLQNARVPEALEDAAELRRRYLDELARRQPEGFRRWLGDGARAASDPSRYIRPPSAPLDRDEDQAA